MSLASYYIEGYWVGGAFALFMAITFACGFWRWEGDSKGGMPMSKLSRIAACICCVTVAVLIVASGLDYKPIASRWFEICGAGLVLLFVCGGLDSFIHRKR